MSKVRKSLLVATLRDRGLSERAEWVERALPDEIDVQRNASLFDMLGIEPGTLTEPEAESADGSGPERPA